MGNNTGTKKIYSSKDAYYAMLTLTYKSIMGLKEKIIKSDISRAEKMGLLQTLNERIKQKISNYQNYDYSKYCRSNPDMGVYCETLKPGYVMIQKSVVAFNKKFDVFISGKIIGQHLIEASNGRIFKFVMPDGIKNEATGEFKFNYDEQEFLHIPENEEPEVTIDGKSISLSQIMGIDINLIKRIVIDFK